MRLLSALLLFLALVAAPTDQAWAKEQRFALVIGAASYGGEFALRTPIEDAKHVNAFLTTEAGFTAPPPLIDPTEAAIQQGIRALNDQVVAARGNGDEVTVLVYFAGHGFSTPGALAGEPLQDFIIPIGTRLMSPGAGPSDFQREAISVKFLVGKLGEARPTRVILIIDACRSNSGAGGFHMDRTIRLDQSFLTIIYSTGPGSSAQDIFDDRGAPSRNSPFATALVAAARAHPSVDLEEVTNQTNAKLETLLPSGVVQRLDIHVSAPRAPFFLVQASDVQVAQARQQILASGGAAPNGRSESAKSTLGVRAGPAVADPCNEVRQQFASRGQDGVRAAAENGDGYMQWVMGVAYSGCARIPTISLNGEESARWLRLAVARGYARAITSLGYIFDQGLVGATPQPVGAEPCPGRLPSGLCPNLAEARNWWTVGDGMGVSGSTNNLGNVYELGRGVGADPAKALKYYERAAREGDGSTLAARNLARMYAQGVGVEKDPAKAVKWYEFAAARGDAEAAGALASTFATGIDVRKDDAIANDWYQKAIDAGGLGYVTTLVSRLDQGVGAPANPSRATELLRLGAEAGDGSLMMAYADRLKNSGGANLTTRQWREVLDWYQRAVDAGEHQALTRLAGAYGRGVGVPRDQERAVGLLRQVLALEERTDLEAPIWPMVFYDAGQLLVEILGEGRVTTTPAEIAALKARYGHLPPRVNRQVFSVPIDCGGLGSTEPFQIYVFDWEREYSPVKPQLAWISERGCTVSPQVGEAFDKLFSIAKENNVSFTELVIYALGERPQNRATDSSGDQTLTNSPPRTDGS